MKFEKKILRVEIFKTLKSDCERSREQRDVGSKREKGAYQFISKCPISYQEFLLSKTPQGL